MDILQNYVAQNIAGKSILVTGGTTGIGRATAILLASQGGNVITMGTSQEHLDDAIRDIKKSAAGTVHGFLADLSTEEGIRKVFSEVDLHFGSLDILVNNAALPYGSVTEGDYSDWKHIVDTNLLAYLACTNEAVARMKENHGGHIVNIGSMSADVREKTGSVYVATKSAIQGFSESLRKQINPYGIKLTLIEPGAVDTDMQEDSTEIKKGKVRKLEMLAADDIAAAVLYCLAQPLRCDVVELKIRPHLQII